MGSVQYDGRPVPAGVPECSGPRYLWRKLVEIHQHQDLPEHIASLELRVSNLFWHRERSHTISQNLSARRGYKGLLITFSGLVEENKESLTFEA